MKIHAYLICTLCLDPQKVTPLHPAEQAFIQVRASEPAPLTALPAKGARCVYEKVLNFIFNSAAKSLGT